MRPRVGHSPDNNHKFPYTIFGSIMEFLEVWWMEVLQIFRKSSRYSGTFTYCLEVKWKSNWLYRSLLEFPEVNSNGFFRKPDRFSGCFCSHRFFGQHFSFSQLLEGLIIVLITRLVIIRKSHFLSVFCQCSVPGNLRRLTVHSSCMQPSIALAHYLELKLCLQLSIALAL